MNLYSKFGWHIYCSKPKKKREFTSHELFCPKCEMPVMGRFCSKCGVEGELNKTIIDDLPEVWEWFDESEELTESGQGMGYDEQGFWIYQDNQHGGFHIEIDEDLFYKSLGSIEEGWLKSKEQFEVTFANYIEKLKEYFEVVQVRKGFWFDIL